MKLIEHSFSLSLEGLSEEIVQVLLISLVDASDGDRAAIASRASASCTAGGDVGAALGHCRRSIATLSE